MARHAAQNNATSRRRGGALGVILGIICSTSLAISLFAAGFAACTLQPTTHLFSRLFSDFSTSAFLPDDTVALAVATRDFTVKPYGRGAQVAAEELAAKVVEAATRSAAPDSPKTKLWAGVTGLTQAASSETATTQAASSYLTQTAPTEAAPTKTASTETTPPEASPTQTNPTEGTLLEVTPLEAAPSSAEVLAGDSLSAMYALARQGESYGLSADAMQHLTDCNKLINTAAPILIVVAIVAFITAIILRIVAGKRALGIALVAAPSLLVAAMVGLGIWAAVDFQAFFAAFHGLFFPQGNWIFPADSLLICMLPTGFWIAMAVLWVLVTVLCALACVAIGLRLARR